MLSDISQRGIGYDADLLDVLVVISHKAKMARHCPKALPSRKGGDLDDETGEISPLFNVGINRLRELHEVASSSLDLGRTYRIESALSSLCSIMPLLP